MISEHRLIERIIVRVSLQNHIYTCLHAIHRQLEKKVHMLNNIRIEEDLLGTREVPADAYYGVHTLRAIETSTSAIAKSDDIPEFGVAWLW
jgi:aspartate ammonia-lyase